MYTNTSANCDAFVNSNAFFSSSHSVESASPLIAPCTKAKLKIEMDTIATSILPREIIKALRALDIIRLLVVTGRVNIR